MGSVDFGAAGGPQARKAAKRMILRCFNIGIPMLTGGSAKGAKGAILRCFNIGIPMLTGGSATGETADFRVETGRHGGDPRGGSTRLPQP